MARKRSQASVSSWARRIGSSGIAWPNEIVADFTTPPQPRQSGASPVASKRGRTQSSSWRSPQSRQVA